MTYAVVRLLAHIEKGETRDSFGQLVMDTLCGTHVTLGGRRAGEMTGLPDPMFYPVCGNCRRIERQTEARRRQLMPTKTTGPQALNVTYLVPFAGNRMNQPQSGPIHILRREVLTGSETWCGLRVTTGRTSYSQRTRLKAAEEPKLHDACFTA